MAFVSKKQSSASAHQAHPLEKFDLDQIKLITNEFSTKISGEENSFGTVYKGEHCGLEVAVKVYTSKDHDYAMNEREAFNQLASGKDEWEIGKQFASANIVPLLGTYFETSGKHYFVMKFIPHTLKYKLNAAPLDWASTVKILKQIANAISTIAKKQFVHGDIKPDNILVDEESNAFLCDFGSAKKIGQKVPTNNNYYAPKELVNGLASEKTDVFSFGVIVFQMIMKLNEFGKLNFGPTKKATSKKKSDPHIAEIARVETKRKGNCVHKTFTSSCSEEDARKISQLGIECTHEAENTRPNIDRVLVVLGEIK